MNIIVENNNFIPKYARNGDAGADLRAKIKAPMTLKPMQRVLIPVGVKIALKDGYEAQVRPRSGLAFKYGITVLNTPGTIDGGYRDEIGVILVNLSDKDFVITPEDKIAQLVINKFETVDFNVVENFTEDEIKDDRGGGFGHTDEDEVKPKAKRKYKKRVKKD